MTHRRNRIVPHFPWWIGCLVIVLIVTAIGARRQFTGASAASSAEAPRSSTESSGVDDNSASKKFTTTIRQPSGPPVIHLDQPDPQGRVGQVACSTCHSVREPDFDNRTPADLDQFHQQMPMAHGELSCYSCHNPDDADTLRLADTTVVQYTNVMTLCSQCHGPQARDYEHGAHGGMNGYWDLNQGPRQKNNCIDCHDPHVPKFPSMQPSFKPRDRFLNTESGSSHTVQESFLPAEAHDE